MRSLFALLFLIALGSCMDNSTSCTKSVSSDSWTSLNQTSHQQNIQAIDAYLDANGIVAIEDESGLRYVITQNGTGGTPSCLEKNITVTYEGKVLSTGVV